MQRVHNSSEDSAARFLRTYSKRARNQPARASYRISAEVLDETILRYVGRYPRRSSEIFLDVIYDYGTVHVRRLWSRMALLRERGEIEHTNDGYVRARRAVNNRAA